MKAKKKIPAYKIKHKCQCGIMHEFLPSNAREWLEDDGDLLGYLWECDCKSTLFVLARRLKEEQCYLSKPISPRS